MTPTFISGRIREVIKRITKQCTDDKIRMFDLVHKLKIWVPIAITNGDDPYDYVMSYLQDLADQYLELGKSVDRARPSLTDIPPCREDALNPGVY